MTNVAIANTESLGVRSPFPIVLFVVGGLAIERIVSPRSERQISAVVLQHLQVAILITECHDQPHQKSL
jgi:uncharacterized membrane protein YoaK (UPF0700 family)